MKRFLVMAALGAALVVAGCKWDRELPVVENGTLPDRKFWAHNFITQKHYQVDAVNTAVGRWCVIYQDKNAVVSVDTAQALAQEFDEAIYPVITANFGDPLDVDDNGKIILLLLDIRDGGSKETGYTAGYFWAGNMYQKASNAQDTAYYSNEADMLYIDTYPGVVNSEACRSTVAHEMQHLVNFSVRTLKGEPSLTDTWIDEGLSTAAEDLYLGKRLDDRIEWFVNDPLETIRYGNNFYVWDGYWENKGDALSNYATVYLFFQWLRIHAVNGAGIYRDIINHRYGDYRAVAGAAADRFFPAIDGAWETLLRTWYAANLLRSADGLTGYRQAIDCTVHYLSSGGRLNLYPGEGVYSLLTTGRAYPDTGNIRYAGLKRGEKVDTGGAYTKDWHLLTLNVDTNGAGGAESGALGSIVAGAAGALPYSAVLDVSPAPSRSIGVTDGNTAGTTAGSTDGRLPTIYDWDSAAAARKRFNGEGR